MNRILCECFVGSIRGLVMASVPWFLLFELRLQLSFAVAAPKIELSDAPGDGEGFTEPGDSLRRP